MSVIPYQTPGVYIEEVPSGAHPIQAVGTRTAGFVGTAPNHTRYLNEAVAVNNWSEFIKRFISPTVDEATKDLQIAEKVLSNLQTDAPEEMRTDANDKVEKARQALATANEAARIAKTKGSTQLYPGTDLSNAVYGFFLNGGNRCWIVNVGQILDSVDKKGNKIIGKDGKTVKMKPPISAGASATPVGLDLLEKVDEIAMLAAPGYTDAASYDAIRAQCDKLKDRVGILDGPEVLDDNVMNQLAGEEGGGEWKMPAPSVRGQLTLYVPWIEISDPDNAGNAGSGPMRKLVPPSGHVAGVWARSDAFRGVHKAPANEPLNGALDLARQVTHEEQGLLNSHGVNVIRAFRNEGILVWGARTLTLDSSFRYLNVRRLFNMIEESILESTRWIVFEPNDRPLWQAIRRDVTAFLIGFWRDGALMGRTPQEAFFVKCDEETNPIESIREGKVVIEIGIAPVFPAEFVIFRISQYQAGSEVEVQTA